MEHNNRNIGTVTQIVGVIFYFSLATAVVQAVMGAAVLTGDQSLITVFSWSQTASLITLAASVIGYCVWIYRANANLRDDYELEFTPAACIWWNIVPIASLFKPYQAMREIWNTTLGSSNDFGADDHQTLKLWWGFWITTNILGNLSFRMQGQFDTTVIDTISAFLDIGLFWFAHKIVTRIGTAQSQGISNLRKVFE
jgi:Domain of unknown function (DUF4328)